MFIGYFTERPYQDPKSGYFGATGKPIMRVHTAGSVGGSTAVVAPARLEPTSRS
jgi:hypothetical protein